jgi:hypothetical protein
MGTAIIAPSKARRGNLLGVPQTACNVTCAVDCGPDVSRPRSRAAMSPGLLLRRGGMNGPPVLRDVDAPRHPDVGVLADVIEKSREPDGARRIAHEAHVHADRHHARMARALLVERVEAVADELEPLVRGPGLGDARILTCGAAALIGVAQYRDRPARITGMVLFVVISITFNPFIPLHLSRSAWFYLDLGTATILLLHLIYMRRALSQGV